MKDSLVASVIIPVYNGEKTIRACLNSIYACKSVDFEVIVVDDGSTDGTRWILQEFPCRVIPLPQNKGRGHARNRGIEASRAPWVLLTDADCVVGKDWVSTALRELRLLKKIDKRIVGVAGRVLPMDGFFNKCDAYAAYGYNQNHPSGYTDNFCTSNLVVEKKAILQAGLFDERLPAFEDLDLGLRLLTRGFRLYYQPALWVLHNHTRLGLRGFLSHEFEWGKSIGNYFDTHYPAYHPTPITRWMGHDLVYLLSAPLFALGITCKILAKNVRYDPSIIFLTPFILLSKLLFRIGGMTYMRRLKTIPETLSVAETAAA